MATQCTWAQSKLREKVAAMKSLLINESMLLSASARRRASAAATRWHPAAAGTRGMSPLSGTQSAPP